MEQCALCWPYAVQLLGFPAMKSTRLCAQKTSLPCFMTEYHQPDLAWRLVRLVCQSQVRKTSLGNAEPRLPYSGQLGLLKGDKYSYGCT